jgi:hypothetical protein
VCWGGKLSFPFCPDSSNSVPQTYKALVTENQGTAEQSIGIEDGFYPEFLRRTAYGPCQNFAPQPDWICGSSHMLTYIDPLRLSGFLKAYQSGPKVKEGYMLILSTELDLCQSEPPKLGQ